MATPMQPPEPVPDPSEDTPTEALADQTADAAREPSHPESAADTATQPGTPAPRSVRPATIDVLVAVGLLIVCTVVLGMLVMRARRRLLARHETHDELSLMESLRRMRDRGDMSIEEFEQARRALIGRATRRPPTAAPPAPALPNCGTPDAETRIDSKARPPINPPQE